MLWYSPSKGQQQHMGCPSAERSSNLRSSNGIGSKCLLGYEQLRAIEAPSGAIITAMSTRVVHMVQNLKNLVGQEIIPGSAGVWGRGLGFTRGLQWWPTARDSG
eukprot:1136594-Pelagomonas_calceolata.AAC.2